MSKLPWYRLWVVEHQSEAARWTAEDEGYCLRLMNAMWQAGMEGDVPPGLPDDPAAICELIGCTERQWDRLRRKFLLSPQTPFTISAGTISHKRLTDEWAHALDKSGKAKESAEKRWRSSTNRNTNAMRTHSERNARDDASGMLSQNTELRTQNTEDMGTPKLQVSTLVCRNTHMAESAREKNDDVTTALSVPSNLPARSNGNGGADFERFIEAYPKHRARGAAYEAWRTLHRSGKLPPIEVILADIERHIQLDPNWRTERFTPNPARYLTDELWLDQYNAPRENALIQALAEGR